MPTILSTSIALTLSLPGMDALTIPHATGWTLDAAIEYIRVVGPTLPTGGALRLEVEVRSVVGRQD